MKQFKTILIAAIVGILLAQSTIDADEKGTAVLRKAADYLSQSQTLRFETGIMFKGSINGQPEALETDYSVTVARPDKVAVTLNNRELTMNFYSDGTTTTRFLPDYDQYMEDPAPTSPAMALQNSSFAVIDPAIKVLSEMLMENPFETIKDAAYIGTEKLNEKSVDHIQIDYNGTKADLWIEQGSAPRIVKVQPDMSAVAAQMKAQNPNMTSVEIEVFADITDWVIGGKMDALLAFNPPADAQKVAQFNMQPPPPANALLGKPAPDFKLDVMDGGSLEIAAKKADEILILDFWATWCGPCRKAMPILEKVSKEFADQGVKLYAVNLEEDSEEIKNFLTSQKLDVMVALDSDSSVAAQYMVQGIPQTVIIGKDGSVQVVHVGVSPYLETQIRDELTALVKGERLAD
jgi:thiol-disulfide isomerase/thioredoxin